MHYRMAGANIDQAIQVISNCQYLMSLAAKAHSQLEAQKYFSALKTLDQLQRLHLPRFHEYAFAKHLANQIPHMVCTMSQKERVWAGLCFL